MPTSSAFFLDTNVFVAAICRLPRRTASHELFVDVLGDERIRLVSDPVLESEYRRNAHRFHHPDLDLLLPRILGRFDCVHPRAQDLAATLPYFTASQRADAIHAAACLRGNAILVSKDRDFSAVARAGLVTVWRPLEMLAHLRSLR